MSKPSKNVTLRLLDGGRVDESGDYIEDVFGPRGYLSKLVSGYQPRPGQVALARSIDQAIRNGTHAIAEGPTGTGKSFAYSVPAAYHAIHSSKRVCIVTANKTLQSQIVNKDLEELRKATGWKFSFTVRKGASSYLCARDYARGRWEGVRDGNEEMVDAVRDWADTTKDGDREESPGPTNKIWRSFSTTSEECDGPRECGSADGCFLAASKVRAKAAHIVVTNYHLLYRHLTFEAARLRKAKLKCEEEGREWDLEIYNKKLRQDNNGILPVFDVLIMDEAHHAPEIARDHLGEDATISWSAVHRCLSGLHDLENLGLGKAALSARSNAVQLLNDLWDDLDRRLGAELVVFGPGDMLKSEGLEAALLDIAGLYMATSSRIAPKVATGKPIMKAKDAEHAVMAARLRKLADRCADVTDRLNKFRTRGIPSLVYFAQRESSEDGAAEVKLKAKALLVGRFMREEIFDKVSPVIQVSATLAIKNPRGSDFDHVRREMGMRDLKGVSELVVPSPFNWHQQSLLVVPSTMPMYESKSKDDNAAYNAAALEHMEAIIRIVKGRTLVLFTSHKSMRRAAGYLRARLPYEILVQGEGTNRDLQDLFRSSVNSVLLGTESFAEGVDIQGEACTCVILEKLSFAPPNDPVLVGLEMRNAEILAKDKNANVVDVFKGYRMPMAITKFKQRTGRLLRSIRDVGIIACLDRRVADSGYSYQFLGSIPPIRLSRTLHDIEPFLKSLGAL